MEEITRVHNGVNDMDCIENGDGKELTKVSNCSLDKSEPSSPVHKREEEVIENICANPDYSESELKGKKKNLIKTLSFECHEREGKHLLKIESDLKSPRVESCEEFNSEVWEDAKEELSRAETSVEDIADDILSEVWEDTSEFVDREAGVLLESVIREVEDDLKGQEINPEQAHLSVVDDIPESSKDEDCTKELLEFVDDFICELETSAELNEIINSPESNCSKMSLEGITEPAREPGANENEPLNNVVDLKEYTNVKEEAEEEEEEEFPTDLSGDIPSFGDEEEVDLRELGPPNTCVGIVSQEGSLSGRTSQNSGGRRSSLIVRGKNIVEEDHCEDNMIVDYLYDVQEGAEARLAARRQARAEARDIRMKELEKQQKESEENADKSYDMYSTDVVNRAAFRVALGSHRAQSSVSSASYHSSRRSSEDSSEDGIGNIRDMRHELKELEDKFRKSMIQNAQQDNEKSALTYNVELLKDKIEDLEESLTNLQREHRDKCRDYENLRRVTDKLKDDLEFFKYQLKERDDLIKDYGLVVIESEIEVDIGNGEKETRIVKNLVTQQSANVLNSLGKGSLDVRLNRVLEEKNDLTDEIRRLKIDLEEERNKNYRGGHPNNVANNHMNGPEGDDLDEIQRETSKQMAENKYKIQKYEQEIATLQANVARLESQVFRYKQSSEEAEAREEDLKVEKRKLQREHREAQSKLDELETTNSHLQKRLDKLKVAKSQLFKDL